MKATSNSASATPADLTLLTYAMHMVETVRSDAAKRLFQSYVDTELRRFKESRSSWAGRREEVVGDRLSGNGMLTEASVGHTETRNS